ncbi:hypothetical protein AAEX63_05870 [Luteococcus sp. H138]|uniref:hypothetical protein n=1 Tax=unclassified Luteococcus TaxID=2639923 RepID=UPI00313AC51D
MTHTEPMLGSSGTSAASPEDMELLEGEAYAPQPRLPMMTRLPIGPRTRGLLVFVLLTMLVGALTGVLWHLVVDLPTYQVDADGRATISERGLTQVFSTDAWFCLFGMILGTTIGVLAWRWFRRLGWPVTLLAFASAVLSGLLCWWVGMLMGPHNFRTRIAQAGAGESVPIDFQLHAWSSMLVWPFFATIPILLYSSLGVDEQIRPRVRRPRTKDVTAPPVGDQPPSTPVPPPAG